MSPDKSLHYYVRPEALPQSDGYYWPDGVPSWYTLEHLRISTYWEEDGTEFHIAYTREQIEDHGMVFAPFMPLSVGRAPEVPTRPFTEDDFWEAMGVR